MKRGTLLAVGALALIVFSAGAYFWLGARRAGLGDDCRHMPCEEGLGCSLRSLDPKLKATELMTCVQCDRTAMCRMHGQCAAVDGRCRATDEACQRSELCKTDGRCSANEKGACVLAKDADCRRTAGCKAKGLCSLKDGACALTKDEDCQQTKRCKEDGLCALAKESSRARCIASKDGCRKSKRCAEYGSCTAVTGYCLAVDDDDCKKSKDCKENGKCKVMSGICIKGLPSDQPDAGSADETSSKPAAAGVKRSKSGQPPARPAPPTHGLPIGLPTALPPIPSRLPTSP